MPRAVPDSGTNVRAPRPRPQNAIQGIASTAASKAANNYKQGITQGQPANTYGAAPRRVNNQSGPISPNYGGTNNTRQIYTQQMAGNAPVGYTRGGFDDPSIDWGAIYNAMVAPQNEVISSPPSNDYGGVSESPQASLPAVAPVMQAPAQYTAPSVQAPVGVTGTAEGTPGAPSGLAFNAIGMGGTFGAFERLRQARSPRNDLSVTPEMLRATAKARMGSF